MSSKATPKSLWRVFTVVMNCLLLAFLPGSDAYSQRVYASSQTNGVTGLLCLACNVDNPTNSVGSGNLDDYAQFNVTVGLAASVYQVLNFPAVNPNQGCDSLVIGIGSSNDVLAANLLGGVTVSTYNGNNTTPLETFPASTSLLRLLAGSQRGEIVLRPTQRFDRVRITLNGGLLGALSNFRLYYAYRNQVQLTPPNITTGSSISTCSGSPVTLQASTTTPGAVISWYDAPTGGNQLPTPGNPQGTSISVSPTATTTYYAQVSLDNCTNTTRSAITVNVNPLPAAPVIAVTNQVICGGQQATFSVSAPVAGVTYRWYTVPSGGTEVGTGTSFTTPTLSSTTVYYAEAVQIATGCASTSRVPVTATVNPTPAAPTITPTSITIQGGSTAAFSVQNPDPSATYTWYNLSTGGTALATGTSFTTPALFATTSYYVEARSNQGCASLTRTQVTANVNVQNNVPCSFATQQVSPVINGVCLLCGVSDPTLAVDTDTSSASTIFATVGALGSSGQLLQFPNNYAATDSIVLVLETPGTLLALSALSSITVTTYSGTTSNNDTRGLNAGLINLQLISGTNKYRVSFVAGNNFNGVLVSINGLLSALPQLRVYYAAVTVPQAVPTSASLNICTGSSATLTVTAPASATVNWYDAPAGGNLVVGNTTTYTTPVLTASRTYYVATGKYGCENGLRVPVIVTVNTPPATPTVNTSNLTACAGDSVTFVANGPAGATFYWYTAATGGSPIDSGVTFTTPGLSATTMFYVEAANNSCVSAARFAVTATVNDAPASVTVTPPVANIALGQTASFAASSTTPDLTFNWFNQPAGGTSIFTGSNFVTPALVANTTYYVEGISNTSGCNTITRSPATVIVGGGGANDVPCDVATAQTNGVNGVCLLCAVNNPQLAIDTDASTGTDLRVGVGLLGAYAQQTLIFPSAGNAGDSIIFSISVPSSLADVGLLSTVQVATYNGATFNNDLQSVNSNLLQLRLLGDNRTAIFTLPATAAYDRVEIRLNSGVAGALTSVYLNYAARKVAVPTFQADTVTICTGNTAILNVTAPPAGVTFNWYTSATGGTPFYTGNSYQTAVLTRDTTFYVESVRTVSGCVNPVRSAVRVAVAASVPAPTVAASAVTVCAGNPAMLTATGPAGATFRWYAQQTGGTALFTGAVYTTAALDSSVLYYVEAVNAGGCASANRTAVQVNVTAEPPAPVINTTAPVACEGSTVTLSASSNVPGATIKWYANASGDTAIATGNSFATPALTATTTYYAGVDAGQCSSSSRTAVTVTVSARPAAPTVTIAPAGQVPYGQTATLNATSATPNVTFRWYSDSTSTSPLATGNSFTTPALSNTTRYFVEAVSNVSGCASNARTAVTVTVDRNFDPGCDVANAQDNAVGGICVACNVTNPDNAVDNDLNNYSNLHVTLGVAGAYSSQTLRFPFASGPGDSVRLKLELPGSVVNAGLLGAISIASYNGATYNNDRILLNDNLIKVDVLGGATGQVIVTFAPAASFDRVELRLNSGLALALSDLRVYYANRVITAPVVTPPSATICAGSTVTFTATASAEATINWYDAPTGGTLLTTGASYTTPQLNAITTYYVEAVRTANGCANPIRTQVMVNVRPVPQPPVITSANPSICAGQTATLRATTTDGSQVRWYDAPVNGTLLATDSTFITPALNSTTIYYAEAYNGTCSNSGARVAVTVTVGANVIPPVLDNANQSVCVGSNAVVNVVSPVAGYTYTWYTSLTGGTPVATGPTFTTPVLTASTIYYVEATTTGGTCAGGSTRVQAVINVSAAPALPVVVNPTPITCIGTSAQLSIQNPVAGVTYTWYNVATGGTPLAIGTTFNTPALTGTTTYYVSAVNSNNCASNGRASVTITANATPNTPALTDANVTVCRGSSTTLQVANAVAGVTYTWYDASVGGNVVFTGTSFATPAINANTSYYVEASQPGGCVSNARAVATVSITDGPSMPAVSAGPTICAGNSARLQVINPQAGILYSWFDAVTGGNQLAEDSVFFTTPALNATTTYYVQASAGTCASSSRVSITVTVSTTAGTVTLVNNSLTACRGTTVTFSVQNPQPGVTYRWYDALTGGNLVGTGADFTTPSLTGRSSYFVEGISATGCNSPSRTTAIANIIDPPTPPAVQAPEVTVCRGNTTVLAVDGEDVNYIYRWYDAPTGGNQVGSGGQFTTPAMNATTTYYVDAATTSGTCVSASRTAVKVNVVEQPAAPVLANAGIVSACAGATATFSVQNILPGATYRWYDAPTGGNLVYTGASFVTGVLSGPATYYVETVLSGTCVSSTRAQATANITVAPVAPVIAGHDAAICANNRDTLTATSLTPGVSFRWYSSLTETTPIFTGNVFITPLLTATTTYYVDAALPGGCVSAIRTPVIVEVAQPLAMPTVTVLDTEPTSITFQWNAVAGAIAYQVSTDGGITVQTPSSGLTGTSHTIQNLVPGQTVTLTVRAIGLTPCSNSGWFLGASGTSDNPNGNVVFIPNAFTPNNDGSNDILYVYGNTIAKMSLRIFNQWGQLVFESKDKAKGWDGTMSGQRQPVGVYVYEFMSTMTDGTKINKRGTITIIR